MFDTYITRRESHDHHHRVEVTEKRAPTDESVRLLREMEAKALENVLQTVRLEGCPVDCVIHRMNDVLTGDYRFVIRYRLGSKDVRVDHRHSSLNGDNPAFVAQGLVDALARSIACEVLNRASDSIAKVLR